MILEVILKNYFIGKRIEIKEMKKEMKKRNENKNGSKNKNKWNEVCYQLQTEQLFSEI
ncbi:hypothetical protein MmiHf6_03340 [Methanimicrococcus hongohii]|uniref:Uncharacterized protein n=1 Tax=Methanimicrococcus hongohii TaxID=3028295 RepID=A0AA96UZN1_9EURY|nr:hypothetical protein [Methanimicrococcus sp. Hf6]WNY23038.1 hypothetical protein MmiHf6_03340 [Methanimicrococcus sp. Hf6]